MTVRHLLEDGMFVREAGPAAGPPLLLVHGLGESGLCFEHLLQAPELAGWRLLVPDLPGYGRSPWPAGAVQGLADQADFLCAWLARRREGPAVVVGHSMGGVVALLMAEGHPAAVRAVVDVDGNKSPADCVFSGQAAGQDLATFCAGGFDRLRARVHDQGITDPAQRGYHVSLRLADPRTFHRNSRELVEMSARGDLARRLAALPLPKLYIAGAPGGAAPSSREQLAVAGIPPLDIAPSGHWPFIDRPADFLAALAAFLRAL